MSSGGYTWRKAAAALLGLILILCGIPLLVTRGPGLPLIALGVGVLVYEFVVRDRGRS